MRSEIGLADYWLAIHRLEANDRVLRRRIAELLGIDGALPTIEKADMNALEEVPVQATPGRPVQFADVREAESPVTRVPSTGREIPLRIETLASSGSVDVGWPRDLPDAPDSSDSGGPRVPAPALLRATLERGVVQMLLAAERPCGDLDLEAVLDACVRLEVAEPLPQLTEWTVLAGTDVLVDVSPAMAPFDDDVDRLIRSAVQVGGEATRIYYFEQCPSRGVFSDDADNVFVPDRRVVVVGTFGYGPSVMAAGPEEWRQAILDLRGRSPVVGICPFVAACRAFGSLLPMVSWTEVTTTTSVVRVLRAG